MFGERRTPHSPLSGNGPENVWYLFLLRLYTLTGENYDWFDEAINILVGRCVQLNRAFFRVEVIGKLEA